MDELTLFDAVLLGAIGLVVCGLCDARNAVIVLVHGVGALLGLGTLCRGGVLASAAHHSLRGHGGKVA